MASISSLQSLSYSSAHFNGSRLPTDRLRPPPSRISFRPLRVSAACATAAERTTVSDIASPGSLYEVLGIQMGATCQEIKAAYRRLARVLHPDVATTSQKEETTYEFIKIHEAYETLSDPEKRADYDRSLFWRRRQMISPFVTSAAATKMSSSSVSGFSGYTRQRWETDQCWEQFVYEHNRPGFLGGVPEVSQVTRNLGLKFNLKSGPVGKQAVMPKDSNATITMLVTGTGIDPFCSFLWKMLFEKHEACKLIKN